MSYSNISLRFSKSKHTSSVWVVTATARPHPHLHCISLNLPAQKGTIKRPTKQMRFPYIRQPCNHISHVVSYPIRCCIRRVTVQPGAGLPPVSSAYRDVRSRWDVSFGASANNITGGNALGDVLQALIPFVSQPISNVHAAALMEWERRCSDQMDATFSRTSVDTQRRCHH